MSDSDETDTIARMFARRVESASGGLDSSSAKASLGRMKKKQKASILLSVVALASSLAGGARAEESIDFDRDIRPILSDNCYPCHGPDSQTRKGKLRLDTKDGAFAVRRGEAAIVPGKSGESKVIARILTDDEDDLMPPPDSGRSLTVKQKALLRRWVDGGAIWDEHWAFRSAKRPELPQVKQKDWSRGAIDRFILAKIESENLEPSPQADPETLIRRLTLELTGLPPTIEEIDGFLEELADDSDAAYEKLVDRLLASPRYGERFVWDWLDASRYADSNGYQGDGERTMWPWRDWAARSMNFDLPFDDFTVEQLAGDMIPNGTLVQKLATGFHRNHMINGEGGRIAEENRVEYVFDKAETTATIWLGVTLECARCHDHKFDQLTQKEYYEFYAFFNNTPVNGGGGNGQTPPTIRYGTPDDEHRQIAYRVTSDRLAKDLEAWEKGNLPDDVRAKLPEETRKFLGTAPSSRNNDQLKKLVAHFSKEAAYAEYGKRLETLRKNNEERAGHENGLPRVMVLEDRKDLRESFILDRGLYNKRGDKVTAGVPAALPSLPKDAPRNRLSLATWLVEPEHPLTSRVTVNRFWQLFFGTGLVKTVGDFGVQGEKPSHPGLLDWLAVDFVENGWSVKRLYRDFVLSATYRQSARVTPELIEKDPLNRLLARMGRYRLPSHSIRDYALFTSGLLVGKIGGPSVNPYQPSGIWEEATFGKKRFRQDHGEKLYRRSLYTFWRRIARPTLFFDAASRQTCTVLPQRTNTPLHALTTLNDVTFAEAARVLARRVIESSDEEAARLRRAFRIATSRRPTDAEMKILSGRLAKLLEQYRELPEEATKITTVGEFEKAEGLDVVEHAAYSVLCSLLLNLDEALTKP